MVNVCNAKQLQDPTRQLALEFLISIAENKPKMCTSVDGFAKNVIYILLQWMLEMPDTPLDEWNNQAENEDDEVDVENYVIAQVSCRITLLPIFQRRVLTEFAWPCQPRL